MRPTDDPLVQAGVLFQPIRGVLFGLVFYLLRDVLFRQKNGWLVTWITLVVIGIYSTFGIAPGSIEGLIYTKISFDSLWGGGGRSPVTVIPSFGSHLLLGEALRKEMAQLGSWDFILHRSNSPDAWLFGASGQFVAG